jgi:hypothetical protein
VVSKIIEGEEEEKERKNTAASDAATTASATRQYPDQLELVPSGAATCCADH